MDMHVVMSHPRIDTIWHSHHHSRDVQCLGGAAARAPCNRPWRARRARRRTSTRTGRASTRRGAGRTPRAGSRRPRPGRPAGPARQRVLQLRMLSSARRHLLKLCVSHGHMLRASTQCAAQAKLRSCHTHQAQRLRPALELSAGAGDLGPVSTAHKAPGCTRHTTRRLFL